MKLLFLFLLGAAVMAVTPQNVTTRAQALILPKLLVLQKSRGIKHLRIAIITDEDNASADRISDWMQEAAGSINYSLDTDRFKCSSPEPLYGYDAYFLSCSDNDSEEMHRWVELSKDDKTIIFSSTIDGLREGAMISLKIEDRANLYINYNALLRRGIVLSKSIMSYSVPFSVN